MELLNELYNKSCKPGYKNYQKIFNNIVLIDNFFENFESARNFFTNRDKWECIPYQNYSKPGYESIFPNWIGRSLLEKYMIDNQINDDLNSYNTVCNFFYNSNNLIWSLSNSNYFPHIDNVENNNILEYICLINLNVVSVSTKFYTFKNNEYCIDMLEWNKYTKIIQKKMYDHYGRKNITNNEVKIFLDNQKNLDTNFLKLIRYKPNQAIIYPANLFHSANTTKEFTKNNPRVLLRISFDKMGKNIEGDKKKTEIIKPKPIKGVSYS